MISHEQKMAAVRAYVAAFDCGDAEAATCLFAEQASVEDPVGSEVITGHEAIRVFYARSMQSGARLTLMGPVRSAGDFAAFAFSAVVQMAEDTLEIDVIDTFQFDTAGRIVAMRAYWGPENMRRRQD